MEQLDTKLTTISNLNSSFSVVAVLCLFSARAKIQYKPYNPGLKRLKPEIKDKIVSCGRLKTLLF